MDLATFRARFPEFASAQDPFVQAYLDEAAARTDPAIFTAGSIYDQAHGYLAAHLLATAPNGQFARLQVQDKKNGATGRTLYWDQREMLETQATVGLRCT